jgi:outer membrane protein assembly factor BamB
MKTPSVLGFALCFSTILAAADWPQWRGPDRTDVSGETGLLKEWPEGGPKKVWLNEDGGLGYAGFSVVNGTLYTMGLRDAVEYVIALDAGTGKEKWSTPAGAIYRNKWGDGPRATPTVDGDHIYAMSAQGVLVCLAAADGKEVWKAEMKDFGGSVPGWGYTESVLVDGDLVICTPGGKDGTLLALNKKTGEKVWQCAVWTDGAQYSSPIVVEFKGRKQYVQRTMQSVAGVFADDGSLAWKTDFPGRTAVIPTPIYHDGRVYVSAGYGVSCKQVELGDDGKATETYANENMINHHGGVILYEGDGSVVWAEKNLGKGAIACAEGRLYLLEESSGTVVLIDASPDGWKEHGRFTLEPQTTQRAKDGRIWTHPVISNGKLYLRDQELIFCFDIKG